MVNDDGRSIFEIYMYILLKVWLNDLKSSSMSLIRLANKQVAATKTIILPTKIVILPFVYEVANRGPQ